MLQSAVDQGWLPAVGLDSVRIHSLQFADDLLIFFDGAPRSAWIIKLILDAFFSCSGLKINYARSSLSPINLGSSEASALADTFGCSVQEFPFTYLGLPLSPKPLRNSDFLPIIEKVDNRLAGWRAASLSRGGRLVLLSSVLSTIPSYFCSVLHFPVWVCKSIDRIRRGFLWNGKILCSGFHCLVRWNNVCRPKQTDGLGICDPRSFNSAFLMKGLWNFYHASSLPWVRLLTLKH